MDSLALLCNLHGDGPATLAGLRELGCYELSSVAILDQAKLISLFRGNSKMAVRFGREALLLAGRLGEPVEEPMDNVSRGSIETASDDYCIAPDIEEFAPGLETSAPEALTPFPALSKVDSASAALLGVSPPDEPFPVAASDPTAPRGIVVDAVLDLWSRLDGREPPANFTATSNLLEAQIEGFSSESAQQLYASGVETLEELVDADILELVTASSIPYTKLAHLQFLARKALGANARMRPEPARMISPEVAPPRDAGVELTPFWSRDAGSAAEPMDAIDRLESIESLDSERTEDGPAGPFA